MKFPKIKFSKIQKDPYIQIKDKINLFLERRTYHIKAIQEIENDLNGIEKNLKELIDLSKDGKKNIKTPKIIKELDHLAIST